MANIKNLNDPTDPSAMGPQGGYVQIKSQTSYNEPGLPPPPAGWGVQLGYSEAQMERDESEKSPDNDEGMS